MNAKPLAFEANFRVNVYQAVKRDAFSLDYEQFLDRLSEAAGILSTRGVCNEPIVRAILGFDAASGGSGKGTIRVTPKGEVLPCVLADA